MKKQFNNRPNKSYEVDGKIIWESRSPALVAIIIASYNNEEYVLVGKRGPGAADYQGYWNVPCGYLDWDEDGIEGITREVYEETGLYIPDIMDEEGEGFWIIDDEYLDQPFYVNTDVNENRQNVSLSYGLYFECEKLPELTNENSEPNEVSEVRWMKISEIRNHKFAFNHPKRIQYYLDKIDYDLPF